MKDSFLHRWLRLFAAVLLFPSMSAVSAAPPAPPQILSVRTNRASLLVTVKVPKGWQAVKLESRASATAGAWVPQAILRSGLASGKVVFKVPAALQGQLLQVEGSQQEPLAKSFYKGKHTFARRKSTFWQPDQGRGEVFSVAANGALPATASVPATGATTRTVVESDIWKVSGDTLYFFNQLRGLQVIDISQPDAPMIRGTVSMPAVGEEMYLLDAQHVVLLTHDGCGYGWNSQVVVVDVSGSAPQVVATLPVSGWVDESRLVGSVLYVASEGPSPSAGSNTDWDSWGTLVSSFDLANPAAPIARSTLWFAGTGNAVLATDRFLFVAATDWSSDAAAVTEVRVIDISAANGTMHDVSGIRTAGEVDDKFKLNLDGDVFTVISDQYTDTPDGNGGWVTTLQTFSLANPASPAALGSLNLAPGEQLYATRFDGNRAYVVTAQSFDPLFVVDLSDPAHPAVAGSVEMPGAITYIAPLGNRLVTLGYDTNWSRVAVSLFDVTDARNPALLSRVPLGFDYSWSEATYDEKALTLLTDIGLILVPYEGDSASGWANRVQLIDLGADALTARGFIQQRCSPRRTTAHNGRLLSVSNQDLLTVDASNEDAPVVTQDTPLAWPVDRVLLANGYVLEIANGTAWGDSAPPTVRAAAAGQPNTIVNSLSLSNLPVVGVTLHSNLLYVLQSHAPWYGPIYGAPGAPVPGVPPLTGVPMPAPRGMTASATNLLMTVVDVSALPNVQVLSQSAIPPTGPLGGSYEALWPTPNLLVWFSTGFGYWINPLIDVRPIGVVPPMPIQVALPITVTGRAPTLILTNVVLSAPIRPMLTNPLPIPVVGTLTGIVSVITGYTGGVILTMQNPPPSPFSQAPKAARASISAGVAPGTVPPGGPATQLSASALRGQPFLALPYWWPWWGNGGVRLLAVNVADPANPQFVSQLQFSPTNGWGFSKAFAAQGLVYFTHEQSLNVAPVQPASSALPIRYDWRVSDQLDVVDFGDPTTPTVRPVVEVPGQLTGLSEDGSILYLLGNAGAAAGAAVDSREAVNACSYDGVAAYVLDSLPLPQTWPRPVLVSHEVVYFACPGNDAQTNSTLQTWTLSDAGKFTRQGKLQVSQPIWALGIFGNLLAAQTDSSGVSLFDASSPSALRLVGQGGPSGCLWFNFNNANGALDTGLYLPLDDYGVAFVPVSF